MKRTFDCGHTGKGKYCHACAMLARTQENARAARESKRSEKTRAASMDPIDLSCVDHLVAVQREARGLLLQVQDGTHPFALKGKPIKSSKGQLVSVPVGRSYRLMFDANTLAPLELLSHESYNKVVDTRAL
ncbi:hypothetical protein ACFQ3P_33120 [Paraburkholderia sabiae]|uniref:Uncharacterized protein n=1 Tax=Paraburkholderia sabiae TaxID=273251 RepID=A0ABU9QJD6_9BURK|nr:hypothetical protein [Paraburkholderia sabiae]WJZ79795.1 hypothetical protein QEN71_43950 [Paraburkholderia sabiae]CAD6559245.1 hypothetical protein LMG24235_06603 [Paraburkholderia sabiae]